MRASEIQMLGGSKKHSEITPREQENAHIRVAESPATEFNQVDENRNHVELPPVNISHGNRENL